MKNIELFPFSRNLYFPGKQLVTRDMEAEQRYFNDKRRLLNSLLHGTGIVCGLNVTAVKQTSTAGNEDGVSVAVEPGLAIDGSGREIVVPEQVYLRLSDLDGFDADIGQAKYAFLCLEYAEISREPMHSVLDNAVADDHFNRIEESRRFYLTYTEPVIPETESGHIDTETLKTEYYEENLEQRLEKTREIKLYLARIGLIRWGNAYAIDEVETVPFRQYVMSAALSVSICETALKIMHASEPKNTATPISQPENKVSEPLVRQGILPMNIPAKLKRGSVIFSPEVPHGLGVGAVSMSAGIAVGTGTIYGANGIFDEPGGYEYAVKTNEQAGTFKIGIRVSSLEKEERLIFSWLAVRDSMLAVSEAPQPYLLIIPGTLRLPVRGTTQFTCRSYGIAKNDILWSIRETEGGNIDKSGFYRAPNNPGVYEITAQSAERPEIRASGFVVVERK